MKNVPYNFRGNSPENIAICGVQVTGFVFLDEDASNYTPPDDLAAFLAAPNEPPIYLGFGSLVLSVLPLFFRSFCCFRSCTRMDNHRAIDRRTRTCYIYCQGSEPKIPYLFHLRGYPTN